MLYSIAVLPSLWVLCSSRNHTVNSILDRFTILNIPFYTIFRRLAALYPTIFPMSFRLSSCFFILLHVVLFQTALGIPLFANQKHTEPAVIDRSSNMAASRTCATWIWLTADIVTSGTETDKFIAFAEANTINRLYIHVDPTISSTVFQSFVAKCSSAEPAITVEALMGDPSWILQTNPSSMTDRLQWVQDYQTSVATNTALQIKGLHLDVEVSQKMISSPLFVSPPPTSFLF